MFSPLLTLFLSSCLSFLFWSLSSSLSSCGSLPPLFISISPSLFLSLPAGSVPEPSLHLSGGRSPEEHGQQLPGAATTKGTDSAFVLLTIPPGGATCGGRLLTRHQSPISSTQEPFSPYWGLSNSYLVFRIHAVCHTACLSYCLVCLAFWSQRLGTAHPIS